MISEDLQKKIGQSVKLLQSVGARTEGPIEIAYSGGKDSDVILQLAKEAGISYRAIYKNTTIDPPGTIKHVQAGGVEIIRPKLTFFQLVAKKGFPNRRMRFCCEVLKEYKVLDKAVIGVRKSESTRRKNRYTEPTQCRYFGRTKTPKNHVEQIYPILDWTDEDVLNFVTDRKLALAPVYYTEDGTIDVTRRLGCMCCPLMSDKKRIEAFLARPRMVKVYIRAGQKYLATHQHTKTAQRFSDVYEWFARDVLCASEKEWQKLQEEQHDYKAYLEQYFNIQL